MNFHTIVNADHANVQHLLQKTESGLFVGIAEGGRSCPQAAKGGALALKAVSSLFSGGINFQSLKDNSSKQETFKMRALTTIHDYLDVEADYTDLDRSKFGSSFIAMYFDECGDFMSIHLGGGEIEGLLGPSAPTISGPERNLLTGLPYTTTTLGACSHIRLRFGNIENWEAIRIASAGAMKNNDYDVLIRR